MADFGDILKDWEAQKKGQVKVSKLPQDGQAWRNKKTEPVKKYGESSPAASVVQNSHSVQQKDSSVIQANPMNVWLQRYGVIDKDKRWEQEKEEMSSRDGQKQIICEASIDLHGLTRDEAWIRLEAYITECVHRGLKKVLIIHGKGNHSEDRPVLSHAVRSFIESDKRLGQFGFADKNLGGKGATWVLIREKN